MQPTQPATLIARPLITTAALTIGLLLSACQKPPVAIVEAPPPLPQHLGPPPAATCTVSPFSVPDGGTASVGMTLSNDGGYCAASLTDSHGRPFAAPLVPVRPQHGDDSVVLYNGKTSIEYAAKPGYAGPDNFTVRLIQAGNPAYTTINVGVTVTASPKTS